MTVAIAAICDWPGLPMIVAAEDRMVTAGDVQFEQPQPKGWQFGDRSIGLLYGSMDAQGEIALATWAEVVGGKLVGVSEIAHAYRRHLQGYISKRAEAAILAPLRMTVDSFMQSHVSMDHRLVTKIQGQLQDYYWDSKLYESLGGAIIAGTDPAGAWIFRVEHGNVDFMSNIGFVAEGSGRRHAESQFMFSGYTREWRLPDAIALVHRAKKRAEVAPGVGRQTDLVAITGKPPYLFHYKHDSPLVVELEALYAKAEEASHTAITEEAAGVKAIFDKWAKQNQAASQAGTTPPSQPVQGDQSDQQPSTATEQDQPTSPE